MKLTNFQQIPKRSPQVPQSILKAVPACSHPPHTSVNKSPIRRPKKPLSSIDKPNRNSLAVAIQSGIQLDSSDLDKLACGWRYRCIPVFVFGLEQSSSAQEGSFGQIHISPKCPVASNYQGTLWASSDYSAAGKAFPQDPLKPCPHCLRHLYSLNIAELVRKDRFGNLTDIDWLNYARYFSSSIFDQYPLFWKNGERPQKVRALFTTDTAEYACAICQCHVKASDWALNPELAERSGIPREICLLCAERRARAVIMAPPQAALRAATLRYESLTKQLGSEPQASWAIAEQVVPAAWLPLVQKLKTLMGPPKVFQLISPKVLAVLCWPSMGRAIIADNAKEATIPQNYSIWRKAQIEQELGLRNP
ncbi:hypothetical protein [uncultured Microbulbifer sp.]|uniref:hypothetical protein n=1 Tax=uncultured Microbulbifer sp. TaxID=348147 RepID=UPI002604D167|nr:hypothetical protein [uncultured Microbulbifer sp.]